MNNRDLRTGLLSEQDSFSHQFDVAADDADEERAAHHPPSQQHGHASPASDGAVRSRGTRTGDYSAAELDHDRVAAADHGAGLMGRLRALQQDGMLSPGRRARRREGTRAAYPAVALNRPAENGARDFPDNAVHTTKYTLLSFVPKLLYEQFRKVTSFYFLLTVVVTAIPAVSPIDPWASLIGLLFILVVAGVREAVEDVHRYRADRRVNMRHYQRLEAGGRGDRSQVPSRDVAVGDLLYVRCDEQIPADLVLLASSNPGGVAFLETSQLDGERHLKNRQAPACTAGLPLEALCRLQGELRAETPHHQLYEFAASLHLREHDHLHEYHGSGGGGSEPVLLDHSHLLLRSSYLRNTAWAVGLVVYSGPETKLALNLQPPPSKLSTVDHLMNRYVLVILAVDLAICFACAVAGGVFDSESAEHPYIPGADGGSAVEGIRLFFSYFVLLSYLIPLSMVISVEITKVVQALFMQWDDRMRDQHGRGMVVKTSNLNDELGLIQYVLSDKTGTLTRNQMEFHTASIRGTVFKGPIRNAIGQAYQNDPQSAQGHAIRDFLLCMSMCHSVLADADPVRDDLVSYRASSPDEAALCKAAAANGAQFLSSGSNSITVRFQGVSETHQLLNVFDFTSERRRMSVVTRSPQGRLVLYCKGSDDEVLSRCGGDAAAAEVARHTTNEFASMGLRTLVLAKRELSEAQYAEWGRRYEEVSQTLEDRKQAQENLQAELEIGLTVCGCTGIEDQLAARVPEAIYHLRDAGIRVWVITGDKVETAISIGYSAQLIDAHMLLAVVDAADATGVIRQLGDHIGRYTLSDDEVAMVIDGRALKLALRHCPTEFLQLACVCKSVLCCRVTPLQKAKVVSLLRQTGAKCLAIGDGANDVSMIQVANVGVGIYGEEGTSAARASDYALQEFQHLPRLLTIHGRYNALRNAQLILYSFYKNAAVFLCQIYFSFVNGFSAQNLYNDFLIVVFNIFLTSLAPFANACFEKDLPEVVLERFPRAYRRCQSGGLFSVKELLLWMALALYHSIIIFYGTVLMISDGDILPNGQVVGLRVLGATCLAVGITIVTLQSARVTCYWTLITHLCTWGSLAVFVLLWFITSLVNGADYFVFQKTLSSFGFWGWLFIGIVLAFLPDLVYTHVRLSVTPQDWEVLREWYHQERKNLKQPEGLSFSPFEDELEEQHSPRQMDTFQRSYDANPSTAAAGGYVPPPFPSFSTHADFSSEDEDDAHSARPTSPLSAAAVAAMPHNEFAEPPSSPTAAARARSGSWSSWKA